MIIKIKWSRWVKRDGKKQLWDFLEFIEKVYNVFRSSFFFKTWVSYFSYWLAIYYHFFLLFYYSFSSSGSAPQVYTRLQNQWNLISILDTSTNDLLLLTLTYCLYLCDYFLPLFCTYLLFMQQNITYSFFVAHCPLILSWFSGRLTHSSSWNTTAWYDNKMSTNEKKIAFKKVLGPRTTRSGTWIWLLLYKVWSYGTILSELQGNFWNSKRRKKMTRSKKSKSTNIERRFEISTWTYTRLPL